jgi:diguanylate cyclase (GGDEF)-like protein
MTLRTKIGTLFTFIILLAIGLAAYGIRALGATEDIVVRLYDSPLVGVNYARGAAVTLNGARDLADRTLEFGAPASPRDLAAFGRMQGEIDEDLGIVRKRLPDPALVGALARAEQSVALWFSATGTIVAPHAGGVSELPTAAAVGRQGEMAAAALDELVELVAANGFTFRARAISEVNEAAARLAAMSGGIVLICALSMPLLFRMLIRPVLAATRIAENVASGTFVALATTARRDEIGRLLAALATMQANLRDREDRAKSLLLEKARAADSLQQTNVRFDAALNNMPEGLLMCDADNAVVVMNRQFLAMFTLPQSEVGVGTDYRDLLATSIAVGNFPGHTVEELLAETSATIERDRRTTDIGETAANRMIAASFAPMPDGGWVTTYEDITERRRSEEQIAFLARHDPLTGLANRAMLQERLLQAIAQAERGDGFALLLLDLDRFKAVNDTLGHPFGDRLLCEVARRLLDTVRDCDTVARMGGDEFLILQFAAVTSSDAASLGRRIVEIIGRPYEIDGQSVVVGTSIGIALSPADGTHPMQLLKKADLALYRAEREGRGSVHFFEPEMDALALARQALELDLRGAMPLGQLELHYQPLIDSRSRHATAFEALLRWHHPTRGGVPPSEFIPIAEDIGLIVPIGAWVLRQACIQAVSWPRHLRVAVNLSAVQFRSPSLVGTVAEALRESGLEADRLELEVTESVLLNDVKLTLSILVALRALGVRIALDDFGTGYSSLSYLRSFPFDTIKIDRSFVTELGKSDECMAIVRAIIGLAAGLHMHTTAEGVETEAQLTLLAASGCTELQGYLISKPVPVRELAALIHRLSDGSAFPPVRPSNSGPPVSAARDSQRVH